MSSSTNGNPVAARLTRWVVTVHLLAVILHMAAAIVYVTAIAMASAGAATAYLLHARMAWVVLALGVLQALAVINPALVDEYDVKRLLSFTSSAYLHCS